MHLDWLMNEMPSAFFFFGGGGCNPVHPKKARRTLNDPNILDTVKEERFSQPKFLGFLVKGHMMRFHTSVQVHLDSQNLVCKIQYFLLSVKWVQKLTN